MNRYGLSLALAAFAALATLLLTASTEAAQYEAAPAFSPSQALPGVPLHGADYSIGERVPVENFQYVFTVNTKWGPFRIKNSDLLRVRLREIAATAKLEEVNGAETAVEAAGATALRPLNTAKDLVTQPAQTIGDTFRGVGHIFGSAQATMNATDPHGDSMISSVTGGASARRKQAFNVGVDPNTTFPPLADQLKRVATASAVGETSANVGMSFVAGPAGFAIGATGTAGQVREMLRDKTPADLEKDGRQLLAAMGVSQATMDAFYANPNLTPTDKIVIVKVLESSRTCQWARALYRRRRARQLNRDGLLLPAPGHADSAIRQEGLPGARFCERGRRAHVDDGQWNREHSAGGLPHLERASRPDRVLKPRRRVVDHRKREPDRHRSALGARLEGRPQGRRSAWNLSATCRLELMLV